MSSAGDAADSPTLESFRGLVVLELAHIYNGPYCGLMFAHLGAEVIKVEPLTGEKLRGRARGASDPQEFIMLNSNKKSIALDLKSEDGHDAMMRLVETADVLIENYAPGALERLGLGPDALLERNPRLVIASGKGYGSSGPYARMSAMDLTVQAMSGAIATSGFSDGPPVKAGPAFTDFSGGIHMFGAAMAALYFWAFPKVSLISVSIAGAVLSNIARTAVAVLIMQAESLVIQLPFVCAFSVLAGIVIGVLSTFLIKYLPERLTKFK